MMSALEHQLVHDYLVRLDAAAATALPPDRRAELHSDISEHLVDALAESDASEAAVRTILDRLGAPEEVVAEAAGLQPPAPEGYAGHGLDVPFAPRTPQPGSRPKVEEAALACLIGSVILFVSVVLSPIGIVLWVAGLVLVAISARWSGTDKVLAAIAYGVLGIPLIVAATSASFFAVWRETCSMTEDASGLAVRECSGGPPVWVPWASGLALAAVLALWAWVAVRLWRHAHRDPVAPPATGLSMRHR